MKSHAVIFALLSVAFCSDQAWAQQCNPSKVRNAPDSRYATLSNGSEVQDKVTKLVWQRCSMGQRWNGKTCLGTAMGYNWDTAFDAGSPIAKQSDASAAVAAASVSAEAAPDTPDLDEDEITEAAHALLVKASGAAKPVPKNLSWRLPTHKELFTLVELACNSPAINTVLFPSTNANFYWSASQFSDDSNFAWGVDFRDGHAGYDTKKGSYSARLVRFQN